MTDIEIDPIPWLEPSRDLLKRWVQLEKLYSGFINDQAYQRTLSVGMIQELLPPLTSSPEQFNQEQLGLLYEEMGGYLQNICRINQVSLVLDRVCEAARWENEGNTTDVLFNAPLPLTIVYYGVDGTEVGEINLVDAIDAAFTQHSIDTGNTVTQGRQEGVSMLLEMFSGEVPLRDYKNVTKLELPTKYEQVFLALHNKDPFGLSQLAIRVKPI